MLFLGVDGGQSGSTALVGDENGRVLGVGRGGPSNHAGAPGGREKFAGALKDAVDAAAGGQGARFECACFGFSGGPNDKDALTREIVHAEKYAITNDASIALSGALRGGPGVIAIAGTGSIAFGRNLAGRQARAGGWGYSFGDEGGAFDIVRQALRAALRFEEGWGTPTTLRQALIEAGGVSDANDLLHRFYTDEYPRARIASFAVLVDEVARAGDAAARDILHRAAQSLASFVSAVRAQLFTAEEIASVSYAGGVFKNAMVLERFRMLVELSGENRIVAPAYIPAAGALIEAYRMAGLNPQIEGAPVPI